MKFFALLVTQIVLVAGVAFAQPQAAPPPDNFAAEREIARNTVDAHGGARFRSMKSLVMRGSVDATASNFPQAIPATFVMIFASEKYRVEINNPFQPLKQAFDGSQTVSSIGNGVTLPPFNRVGFPVLQRVGDAGFVVTSIADNKRKKRGFRVTTPEGFITDFYVDEKTNQIKSYESTYSTNGRTIKTAVEIDKLRIVDGVTVPEKYVQRFDLDQLTFYASFNAKQILVDSAVTDDVFSNIN